MKSRHPSFVVLLATVLGALIGADAAPAQVGAQFIQAGPQGPRSSLRRPVIWHVDSLATGPANGRSWSAAFPDLQDALAQAVAGDQIWVAAGIYVPTTVGGPQSATFLVPDGVSMYGGFTGFEMFLDQRDPSMNPTILSGDINGDDQWMPSFNIVTGNSWNIVTMRDVGAGTRIDGFEFETGHLYGAPSQQRNGAGIHLENSSPTIAGCRFSHCVAASGGAVHADGGSPTVEGCSFHFNYASGSTGLGGAVASVAGDLTVLDSSFTQNTAEGVLGRGLGGAIASVSGSTLIDGCSFSWNEALPRGGLYGNTVSLGGAVHVESGTTTITASRFEHNVSNVGGAVSTSFFGTPVLEITSSVFVRNDAIPITTSSGFDLGAEAGAIYGSPVSRCDLAGCLVYGGTADNNGGAFVGDLGSVSSSIFWGNSDSKGTIGRSQVKARRVYHSCVMNMLVGEPGEDPPDPAHFPGSISLDPMFQNAGAGDFHLLAGSPCIDAADNTAFPASALTDIDGLARFVDDPTVADTGVGSGPIADMGPHERQ